MTVHPDQSREKPLTSAMLSALGSMPITLRTYDNGHTYHLPFSAPHAGTLNALQRRGLVDCDGRQWHRTPLGHAVWEAR
jgi:hypothetical protein